MLEEYLPRVGLGTPAPETFWAGSAGEQEDGVRWDAGKDAHQLVEWGFSFFFLYFGKSPWDSCLCGHGLGHQGGLGAHPKAASSAGTRVMSEHWVEEASV